VGRLRLSDWGTGGLRSAQRDGAAQTTARVRQLVDGIEEALRDRDDLALARFLAPPLLARMAATAASIAATGGVLNPARSGLRWSESRRKPGGPGRCWLRLRFEDLTYCRYPEGVITAPARTHEVEVEIETVGAPWRLCRIVELPERT